MTDPDHVFDDYPIQEYWHDFLREAEIEPGDDIRVTTETNAWKSKMEVVEDDTGGPTGHDIHFETSAGTRLFITQSTTHPTDSYKPTVRTVDGYESRGYIERVEVFKQ